jgi:hypothetical protein
MILRRTKTEGSELWPFSQFFSFARKVRDPGPRQQQDEGCSQGVLHWRDRGGPGDCYAGHAGQFFDAVDQVLRTPAFPPPAGSCMQRREEYVRHSNEVEASTSTLSKLKLQLQS